MVLRMRRAPLHPADLYFVKGLYGHQKEMPCVPGFEGLGEVVEGPREL